MKPRNLQYLSMIAAILFITSTSFAATSAKVYVTATVPPSFRFDAIQHTATYQIGSDDIKRGYIDLPASMTVKVRSNLNADISVFVESSAGSVLIRESGRENFVGNIFSLNIAGYHPNTQVNIQYDLRILLTTDAIEGRHPLIISMIPAI